MALSHQHHQATIGRALIWSLAATAAFVVVEFVVGLRAGSLALLSDAGHNFTDALALLLAAFGFYLESKPADDVKTYGYHRAGVLAAFVNALALVALAGFIFYESYHRLRTPHPVQEMAMLWVATGGLGLNAGVMLALRRGHRHDINVRAAWVHMLGDALGSIGIIVGAAVIRYTGWTWIDPALSILIGLLIVWTARDIIKESLNILLEGLPRGMELGRVADELMRVAGVIDVHDLHIWSLGSHSHALSCHVLIDDMPPSASDAILKQINRVLDGSFSIRHTTIQFEHAPCALADAACNMGREPRDRPTDFPRTL